MWHAYYLSDLHIWICLIWRDLHANIALTNHRFLLILLISRICLHKKMIVSAWLQTRRGLAIRGKFQHRLLQVTKLNPEENFNLFVNNLEAIREGFKTVDTLKRHQIVVGFFPDLQTVGVGALAEKTHTNEPQTQRIPWNAATCIMDGW